ncbi:MAG TPA: MFS transporter, partial [Methanoregulaceae archaeon]|nr:MFS transporter [Methanoregulaceae archaeon]
MFILVIDTSTMEVSISALVHDLDSDASTIQTIVTIYTLVKAAFMLIGAKLQDLIGRKRVFLIGTAVYGVGVFTAAISQNAAMFLFGWSVLEGIGTVLM